MIKVLITNIKDNYAPLLLDLPSTRMFLAINLGGVGIERPAKEIHCNEDGENGIKVKLFGDTDFDNRIVSVLHDRCLSSANTISETIAFMPPMARQSFESDVMENGVGSYGDLIEKIRQHRLQEITERFYCPLTVTLYDRNEYGDIDDSDPQELDGRYAAGFEDEIRTALANYSARDEVNMVEYFDGSNTAQAKLKSLLWGVENIRGELYGVITARLSEQLTDSEKSEVVEYLHGQNADGWGEGFEQQNIDADGGVMNVSFWNGSDDYFIKDQEEFDEYLDQQQNGGIQL